MEAKLFLNHQDRLSAANTVAGVLRQMENPPVRIILFGSVARDQDSGKSDTDILVTHFGDESLTDQYKKKALAILEKNRIPLHRGRNDSVGTVNLSAVDEDFFQNAYELRSLRHEDYKLVINAKAEGIEL
jgi:predicted nucleotidyltransferase